MAISKELVESEFGLVRSGGREFAIGQRRLSTIPHPIHVHLLRSLRNAMVCVSCKALLRSLLLSPAHDPLPSLCDTDHLSTFVKSKALVANLRNAWKHARSVVFAATSGYTAFQSTCRPHNVLRILLLRSSSACSFCAPDHSQVTRLHCTHKC